MLKRLPIVLCISEQLNSFLVFSSSRNGSTVVLTSVVKSADMPHGTDRPYPIRMLAFFEMIRPYQVVIRISGNLWRKIVSPVVCSKTKVLSSTQLHFLRLNFPTDMIDRRFHR